MKKFKLTSSDMIAINNMDYNHINDKGAKLYEPESFSSSVEYYRLAASMGCIHSISNLGYCYLYGRDIEQNVSLAIAYFTIASKRGDIDATYKLGDIYSRNEWVKKDKELSIYYFEKAIKLISENAINNVFEMAYECRYRDYPSLSFAVAREYSKGGMLNTDLTRSYILLRHAKLGYESAIENGFVMYTESYGKVKELINNKIYNKVRKQFDKFFIDDDKDLQEIYISNDKNSEE